MGPLLVTLMLVPRPVLSGPAAIADTADGRFRVHYTLSGSDAPPGGAVDASPKNGIPDDIDAVISGVDRVVARWVGALRAPLPDDGDGGDARIDVYVRRLSAGRGRTTQVDIGVAPGASAYLEIDPRTADISRERLAAVAGHEAFHAIQHAYRPPGVSRWLHEASAAYVEAAGFTDPALAAETDARFAAVLAAPGTPLDVVDGKREYDTLVFIKFLTDRRPGVQVMQRMWEAFATSGDAISAIEVAGGAGIAELLAEWTAWNLHACTTDDGKHYDQKIAGCHAAAALNPSALFVPSSIDRGMQRLSAQVLSPMASECVTSHRLTFTNIAAGMSWTDGDAGGLHALTGTSATISIVDSTPSPRLILATGRTAAPALHIDSTIEPCHLPHVNPTPPTGCSAGGAHGGGQKLPAVILVALLLSLALRRSFITSRNHRRSLPDLSISPISPSKEA